VYTALVPRGTYGLTVPDIGFRFNDYEHKSSITIGPNQSVRVDITLRWLNFGAPGDDVYLTLHNKYAGKITGPAPRNADGKPDLSGVWLQGQDQNPVEPESLGTPWALAVRKERGLRHPSAYCLPSDPVPLAFWVYKIVQTPTLLVQLMEDDAHFRQVFLDGRAHPADMSPTWMGHSIGTWDGDTLVIDTVGFNEKTWLPGRLPHSERLHVIERYRRLDRGRLEVAITFDDPDTFTKLFQTTRIWELVPGEEIQEYVCENNRFPELVGPPPAR
jgi:hypothetical protein